jgi:NADPH:quinone reductase-like Zn-dependent oxidoreductase
VLGLECSGVISEVGPGSSWQVGDRVCALLAGGGMAEEVVVDGRHVLPVPEGMSLAEAAALPEVYATVWLNLFQLAGSSRVKKCCCTLEPVELVQLPFSCARPLATRAGSASAPPNAWPTARRSVPRVAWCATTDLESLRDLGPFDVILDPVGGNYSALNLKLLALDGRWVLIGLMGGREAKLDLAQVLAKRVQLLGSTLRSRDDQFKADLFSDLSQHVWPLFAEGRLSPQLARTFRSRMPRRRLPNWRATRWKGRWCW